MTIQAGSLFLTFLQVLAVIASLCATGYVLYNFKSLVHGLGFLGYIAGAFLCSSLATVVYLVFMSA